MKIPPPNISGTDTELSIEEAFINMIIQDQMEWAEKKVPNYQVLHTLSYERPRWGIQLCKLAQAHAIAGSSPQIRKSDIDAMWGEYGTKRIADLVSEHKHQCSDIEELVLAFRGADRLMTRDQLFEWINRKVTPHVNTRIEGREVRSSREMAQFLYRIGFIVARSDSESGYEHYSFDQMPSFLDSRTNEDFNVSWEIHPCYREALDIQKVDRSHKARFGDRRSRY